MYLYMRVCARIVAGRRHRQNFPPAISKYFWKKSLMRWSTCRPPAPQTCILRILPLKMIG